MVNKKVRAFLPQYGTRPIPEHLAVWVKYNKMAIPKNCIIHHKNQNRTDNRIENLEIMTRSEHSSLHSKTKFTCICNTCGSTDIRRSRELLKH